ncbi:MAG: hypothetical protein QOI74_2364 [Micromonosporaceae bacterium]|nr:hypothetical protein [Micromonosporaceae bacterium]
MVTLRRVLASVAAWTVGAVAAAGVGLLALSLIGNGVSTKTGQPLTPDAVSRAVSAAPATPSAGAAAGVPSTAASSPEDPPSTTPPATDSAASRPTDRLFTTSGGTAIVRCTGSRAYLVSWSPSPGYRFDNVERGPGDRVRVRFRSDENKFDLRATCVGGVPQSRVGEDG